MEVLTQYRVLIVYRKESKQPNAWLSVNGKSRWTKKSAQYHVSRILEGKTSMTQVERAIVKKIETSL